jgi:hypothetical protein
MFGVNVTVTVQSGAGADLGSAGVVLGEVTAISSRDRDAGDAYCRVASIGDGGGLRSAFGADLLRKES